MGQVSGILLIIFSIVFSAGSGGSSDYVEPEMTYIIIEGFSSSINQYASSGTDVGDVSVVQEANNAGLDTKLHQGRIANLYYEGNKVIFDNTSSPNSKRYDALSSGVSISNISVVGSASFDYIMYMDVQR